MYAQIQFRLPLPGPFTYQIPEDMTVTPGMRVSCSFGSQGVMMGVVIGLSDQAPAYETKPILSAFDKHPSLFEEHIKLAAWMADTYLCSQGEALLTMAMSGKQLEKPVQKMVNDFYDDNLKPQLPAIIAENVIALNAEQQTALANMRMPRARGEDVHLLYGVTGSGKTEVYIQLIIDCLKAKRGAIMLVPEFTLTLQLVERVKKVFGDRLTLLHSYLKTKERLSNWMKISVAGADVILGTRSAIFAPVKNLGLVIIDEEHDPSYKENGTPRYHARQIALKRTIYHQAKLVLGSATPALETYYWARSRQKIFLNILRSRAKTAQVPTVEIVKRDHDGDFLSKELQEATKATLARGEQAIFLLNRRGYAPAAFCSRCRETQKCEACSVGLTYHKSGHLVCHLCGFRQPMRNNCPVCDNELQLVGVATQKAEELIIKSFPDAKVARLDQDSAGTSAQSRQQVQATLLELENGQVDILIGTQMIAKGLDFSNVTLVAVLNADIGLGIPDFRAQEKVFHLLVQVAGRAGRDKKAGHVIIQTLTPDMPVIIQAGALDFDAFYKSELATRKETYYPPFCRMVRILMRAKDEQLVLDYAQKWIKNWQQFFELGEYDELIGLKFKVGRDDFLHHTQFIGPLESSVYRINHYFRYQFIIKTGYLNITRSIIQLMLQKKELNPGNRLRLHFDVDPQEMI